MKNKFICDCNVIDKNKVHQAKKNCLCDNTLKKLANLYKLYGDLTRIKIISLLIDNEMCVGDIANVLNMSKSSISHQLAILRKENIVKNIKDGKKIYYKLEDEHIKRIYEIGLTHINEVGGCCEKV